MSTPTATAPAAAYLAQYDSASDAEKFPLVSRWMDREPLPFFAELRASRPVLSTPVCTLVTRLHDVVEVLRQPTVFTVALYAPKMKDFLMAHDDDAIHTRDKSIMQSLLNREDLPEVREMVANLSRGILDSAGGRIEAVNEYCRMVPVRLVQEYFGLDGGDPKDLMEWSRWNQYDAFHNQPFDLIPDDMRRHIVERHDQVNADLAMYLTKLIARKLVHVKAQQAENLIVWPIRLARKLMRLLQGNKTRELKDDVVTRMLRTSYPEAVDFDLQRLGLNAGGLLIGAVETTSQAVAQIIQYILDRPELLARTIEAAAQNDPKEIDGIAWEALRFVPIGAFLFRKAAQDYTLGRGTPYETTIRSGTIVLAVTQSAMFDPAAFENPEEFIPGRNWYHYFHLGFGSHECLGKYIGMVMIPEMVRQVFLRPGIRALGPIDYKSGPFPEQYELAWRANA